MTTAVAGVVLFVRNPDQIPALVATLDLECEVIVDDLSALHERIAGSIPDAVVMAGGTTASEAYDLASKLRVERPEIGVLYVADWLTMTVLAEALRHGVREVVAADQPQDLADALRRVRELSGQLRQSPVVRAEPPESPQGTMITVFSAKGGCGKTTLATNLGAALAAGGKRRVCLVDLDLAFGDVAITLQLSPTHTLLDAVPFGEDIDSSAVAGLITHHSEGLDALVAPIEPSAAERIPSSTVAAVLKVLKRDYDYVVVDCPPAFTNEVLGAFESSEVVFLLATLDLPALKNLKLTIETLDLLQFPRSRCHVVLNRADSKVGLNINEVEKSLNTTISGKIPSSRDVPTTINRGVAIVLDQPKHPVSQAIVQLMEHTIPGAGRTAPAAPNAVPAVLPTERRALLRRKERAS